MIKQLYRIVEEVYEDGGQKTRLPNNIEIVTKINEIINVVNKMEKEHDELMFKSRPNMFGTEEY